MKLAPTLKADSVNAQTLNMRGIAVDVGDAKLIKPINTVCDNGYPLRVVDESDRTLTDSIPPSAVPNGIHCSTMHITETDNAGPYSLLRQMDDTGKSEWIHFTGSEYPLRTDVGSYPILQLKHLGSSKTSRHLVVTLTRCYGASFVHLDVSTECLPGLSTFDG